MKLDHEPGLQCSPATQPTSKSIGYNTLKVENVKDNREGKRKFISLAEILNRERDSESLQLHGKSEIQNDMDIDDSISGLQNGSENQHVTASNFVPLPKFERVKNETDFYMDKAVTEAELPKMIVCFQKDAYQVVKDICVDEGKHSHDKVLLKNDEEDHVKVYMVSHSAGDEDMKESAHCSSESLTGGGNLEKIVNNIPDEKVVANKSIPLQELDKGHSVSDLSNSDSNNDEPKSLDHGSAQQQSFDCNGNHEEANQVPLVDINSTAPGVSSSTIEINSTKILPDVPPNSEVERENVNSVDAVMPAVVTQSEISGTTELAQPGQSEVGSGHVGTSTDMRTSSARNLFVHYSNAESSIYGPASLSDRITYTGQVPYSGSISLRSDSSTTSARSFAFPVLQSEWNSSPVKMAKADRRHYRKRRGWRVRLLCCRF